MSKFIRMTIGSAPPHWVHCTKRKNEVIKRDCTGYYITACSGLQRCVLHSANESNLLFSPKFYFFILTIQ